MTLLLSGVVLGVTAAVTPGPLLTLMVQRTLSHGVAHGVRIALAPLVSDPFIAGVAVVALSMARPPEPALGALALGGALFLTYIGLAALRATPGPLDEETPASRSLTDGVIANLLNPYPYLFWIGVGGPLVVRNWAERPAAAIGFVVAMYGALVGGKVVLSYGVGRGRQVLTSRVYRVVLRALGVAILGFGAGLLWDGLGLLGWR